MIINNVCVVRLKSFIFGNRKKMSKQTFGVLSILVVLLVIASYSYSYMEQYIALFTLIIVAFLSNPRAVVMNERSMKYNLGWKENWSNIQYYEMEGLNILFTTKTIKKEEFRI